MEGDEDPAVGRSDGTVRPRIEAPMELSCGPSMPPVDESREDDGHGFRSIWIIRTLENFKIFS